MKNKEIKKVIKNIRKNLKDYIVENNLKSVVLGISGGIDSALCAALAKPVCDELDIPLIGRSIPIDTNTEEELERAHMIGTAFCTNFKETDLTHTYLNLRFDLVEAENEIIDRHKKESKIRYGNMKARIRMIYLYDLSKKHSGMVLGTTNLSEHLLAYYTVWGDGAVDYELILDIWKTEEYDIAKYIRDNELTDDMFKEAIDSAINCQPTAGLGISSTDVEELGVESYDEVDRILKIWLTKTSDDFLYDEVLYFDDRPADYDVFVGLRKSIKDHKIVKLHESTHFKRNLPISISRLNLFH